MDLKVVRFKVVVWLIAEMASKHKSSATEVGARPHVITPHCVGLNPARSSYIREFCSLLMRIQGRRLNK